MDETGFSCRFSETIVGLEAGLISQEVTLSKFGYCVTLNKIEQDNL